LAFSYQLVDFGYLWPFLLARATPAALFATPVVFISPVSAAAPWAA